MSIIQDRIISIERLCKDVGNINKESYVPDLGLQAVKCNIQPASPEQVAIVEGVFGQTYVGFTTNSGIQNGDKITISGTGELMRVKGVENWSMPDLIPHYELTLVKWQEEEY